MKIEVMDTTLRDGEQTPYISFTESEKLNIAKILLRELKVDRIEIASARVSKGEMESVKKITSWCKNNGMIDRVEILGFVDGEKSLNWINEAGGKVLNLLCKGSMNHLVNQLKKTPEEHIGDAKKMISRASDMGISVNIYLEDWSNGMKDSPEYVFAFVDSLKDQGVKRFMLPDTLGVLCPDTTYEYCKIMVERFPNVNFDFHGHNDYDFAVANTFEALKAGIIGVHTTINGLGERAGNTPLSSIVGAIKDHSDFETNIDESQLTKASKLVEVFSGIRIPPNKPIIGENVFTQCCGVHADGDNKGNLYYNALVPERFGRVRKYALGKTSGKASVQKNLEELGIELDSDSINELTRRVVELGDKKEVITTEDLPYIISDVLGNSAIEEKIKIKNFYTCYATGLNPVATLSLQVNDECFEETATGDGQYDAFMKALGKIYGKIGKNLPELIDYIVTIPPGGKTNALVETVITWKNRTEFKTRGLDSDQTASAVKATMKMLNLIENHYE